MAKLGDLVVNIGANTKQLNKDLGKVRREMKRFGSNFKSLGRDLSRSVTLPLLAIGAAAVKSASDLETLETSFISLTGGAEQARDMMKQLNDFTAKTPFQIDAVANSARQLIASGTGIGEVNDQLQFLGDIAATSGSSINEIAAIFAKVNAKGKVELESLNQLAERGIPIFKALSDATGLPASKLGAGRVSVEQFNAVLKSFAQEGGFAAGAMERLSETAAGKFSTAMDNLKLAGAALADSLMPALKGVIDRVTDLAQKFTALDQGTINLILTVGGLASAFGPVLIVLPQIISSFQLIGTAMAALSGPIGITITAVAALGLGFTALRNNYINNAKDANKYNESVKKIESSVISQTSKVRALVEIYGKEETSLEDRKKILEDLESVDKKHFSNLDAEKTTYLDLTNNLKLYTEELRKNAVQKQLQEESSKLFADLARDEIKLFDLKTQREQENQRLLENGIDISKRKAGTVSRETDLIKSLDFQIRQYENSVKSSQSAVEEFRTREEDILTRYGAKHTEVTNEVIDNNTRAAESYREYLTEIDRLAPSLIAIEGINKDLVESNNSIIESTEAMEGAMAAYSQQIGSTFADAIVDGGNFGDAMKALFKDIIKSLLANAIANAITNASSSSNPVNNVTAGLSIPGFIAAAVGSVTAAFGKAPKLASGGLAFGETLATVGDNRNAAIDPEVIAPLSKLKQYMGGSSTQVYGRISGDDIVISNSRAERDRNRF